MTLSIEAQYKCPYIQAHLVTPTYFRSPVVRLASKACYLDILKALAVGAPANARWPESLDALCRRVVRGDQLSSVATAAPVARQGTVAIRGWVGHPALD